ncbi:MAG: hypothetical protein JSU86_11700, partial [Phycisphaerales bacterium]
MAVALLTVAAAAQPESVETEAFVTVIGGRGEVMRVYAEGTSKITREFSFDTNMIGPGEGVRTAEDTTAVLVLPGYGAVVYLEETSELRLEEPAVPETGVDLLVILVKGRASVIRKPGNVHWLVVAAEAEAPETKGFTLSSGASLFVEARAEGVVFATRAGEAWYYSGQVPANRLIDPSGELIDKSGVAVPQGQRVSTQAPIRPVPDEEAAIVVPTRLHDDMGDFALTQSHLWLEKAEQGEFTPVRGPTRGAPKVLGAEFEPSLAFDQPRPALAARVPRPRRRAVQTTISPAQTFVES